MRELKKLQHRDWSTLRDQWIDHLPGIDLTLQYPEPTLWDLPPLSFPPLDASGLSQCPYVPGVREALLREAILLARKFIYCGALLPTLSDVGKSTWTAVTAYETAFFGAKSFCYLMGFAHLSRDSDLYIDAFFKTEQKQKKRRIDVYDTIGIHKLPERLTHKVLWAMTERLLNTTTFNLELREVQEKLSMVDWKKFVKFRNKIVYDGAFWPLSERLADCDLGKSVVDAQIRAAARLPINPASPPFGGEYFYVAGLLRALIVGMLQTIADVAPSMKPEVAAFGTL